jgi:uncharacterized protein YkwD
VTRSPWLAALAALLLGQPAAAQARAPVIQRPFDRDGGRRISADAACPAWLLDTDAKLAELQAQLVRLVNERRQSAGQGELRLDARLSQVAEAHARHQARLGTQSHRTAETGGVEDRVRAAGLKDWDMLSENLAQGRSINYTARSDDGSPATSACHTPESLALDLVRAWDSSPGHSRTLHEPAFTHIGSGAAFVPERETVYVVHDFARLVTCGYEGALCCPTPAGLAGGICQLPTHCRQGLCILFPEPVE